MKQIDLDCEGPLTRNDNALELSEFFLPKGRYFFSLISRYDDFLADLVKRKGYQAGNTLKLILPFLKAWGATNMKIRDYAAHHLLLVPGAKKTLSRLRKKMPTFIISTSYQPYIEALCDFIAFPLENTYFTHLNLDKYELSPEERKRLKELTREILNLPWIELSGVKKEEDLSSSTKKTIKKLDEIFREEIPSLRCGRMLKEVNPLGGEEKVKAVLDSLKKTRGRISHLIYVGDSITDVEALKLVREKGGVAISFNGNRYALQAAEMALISPHTLPLSLVAEAFCEEGKEGILKLRERLKEELPTLKPLPRLEIIDEKNIKFLIEESERMRKEVRGEAAGKLG